MQVAIPTHVGCGIGVTATYIGIPRTGQTVSSVLPIYRPATDRCGCRVCYTNFTGRTGIPFIGYYVATRSGSTAAVAGGKHSKTQKGHTHAFVGRSSHLLAPWMKHGRKGFVPLLLESLKKAVRHPLLSFAMQTAKPATPERLLLNWWSTTSIGAYIAP